MCVIMCECVCSCVRTCVAGVAYLCETDVRGGESCALWCGGEEGLGVSNPSAVGARV